MDLVATGRHSANDEQLCLAIGRRSGRARKQYPHDDQKSQPQAELRLGSLKETDCSHRHQHVSQRSGRRSFAAHFSLLR